MPILGERAVPSPARADSRGAPIAAGFGDHLARYKAWCDGVAAAMSEYQTWIEAQGHTDGESDLRVYELIESLRSDTLRVALVAEFSRGKTELLNALLYSHAKQRLLPSAAGRTTMCPTELRYDEREPVGIRLLPIETRKAPLSIAEYKNTPVHWTKIHILKPDAPDEVREVMLEVTRTKKVSVREAQELGLYQPAPDAPPAAPTDLIDVPVWRHAIVNFPHPLLKQGLVILDTPGLNALGTEPELTLKMLPEAHAVLFVIAADIGVTRTDLDVWNHHLKSAKGMNGKGRLVVMNKIDVLWDELQDDATIAATLARQATETARTLRVDADQVFLVSAKKGLAGRATGDQALIERSGMPQLERKLAEEVIPAKHELIRSKIVYEVSARIDDSHAMVAAKIAAADHQLDELKRLSGKNTDAIQKLIERMRAEKKKYDKELEGLAITRDVLRTQAIELLSHLGLASLDRLITQTRAAMEGSWTTHGLKSGMDLFFEGALARMEKVDRQAQAIKRSVEGIYQRLHSEYGMTKLTPAQLSLLQYVLAFKRLAARAEAFRNSPGILMTEQHFVIKKYFVTLVAEARRLFEECNKASKAWFQALVSPIFIQIQDHKQAIDRHLETLKTVHKNSDQLAQHTADLETTRTDLLRQMQVLDDLLARIQKSSF